MTEDRNNDRAHRIYHDRDHASVQDGDLPNDDGRDAVDFAGGLEDGGSFVDPSDTRRGPAAAAAASTLDPGAGRHGIRAVVDAYLSADLLQSGPGLVPVGRRARERRARNRAVAEETRRRRARLRLSAARIAARSPGQAVDRSGAGHPAARRPVNRRTQRWVILGLTAVVAVVAFAALWWTPPDPPPGQPPPAAGQPLPEPSSGTLSASTALTTTSDPGAGTLPARPPIPPGGVPPVTPGPDTAVDVNEVRTVAPPAGAPTRADLATPEAAMRAWLARLCPFTYTDPFGTAEERARPAMTDNGWSTLNPFDGDEADQRVRASWDQTVAARESGRCAHPVTQISAEAPRTPTSVVVIGAATRVITSTSQAAGTAAVSPYVEQLSEVRVVRRGTDGLWRVDLPTEGG